MQTPPTDHFPFAGLLGGLPVLGGLLAAGSAFGVALINRRAGWERSRSEAQVAETTAESTLVVSLLQRVSALEDDRDHLYTGLQACQEAHLQDLAQHHQDQIQIIEYQNLIESQNYTLDRLFAQMTLFLQAAEQSADPIILGIVEQMRRLSETATHRGEPSSLHRE